MHPVNFKQAYEKPLGAGENPNTGDLPYVVARDPRTPGPVMLVSCWELSPRELEEVIKTGRVYVAVMAHPEYRTQPPISLHGCNPFEYLPGAAYAVAPRTYAEEVAEKVAADANEILKNQAGETISGSDEVPGSSDRSGLLEASGIFPESKGTAQAKEVRLDPRSDDFDIEKLGKDFNVKPRIGKHEEEG